MPPGRRAGGEIWSDTNSSECRETLKNGVTENSLFESIGPIFESVSTLVPSTAFKRDQNANHSRSVLHLMNNSFNRHAIYQPSRTQLEA